MPRPSPQRLMKALAVASLTLLAGNLVAQGASASGCAHDELRASHFDRLIVAGAMDRPSEDSLLDSRTKPGQMPTCSGPLCSRGPAAPTPAPWASAPLDDSWAVTIERVLPVPPPASPLPPEATPVLPSPRGPSVFHPPRPSTI